MTSAQGGRTGGDARPSPDDARVARSLAVLGLPAPAGAVARLSAGGSGAQVFGLDVDAGPAVLKVTEDPAWRQQARRELAAYRAGGPERDGFRPALLAAHDDGVVVRLLLAAHPPYRPARTLSEEDWLVVADGLGRLHRLPVPPGPWPRPRSRPSAAEVAAALRGWDGHGCVAVATRAARRLAGATDVGPGPVLAHGDCHVGNLVRGSGDRPLWVDWQETCVNPGLGDLVFLWQRAEFDGARPPREVMTRAYADARGLRLDTGLRSALATAELHLLLLAWPGHLRYGSEAGRTLMTARLAELAAGTDER